MSFLQGAIKSSESDSQFPLPLSSGYQQLMLKQVGEKLPELVTYPFYTYPNAGFETTMDHFPNGKVTIFGYGSLMNKASAGRTIKAEALDSMRPMVAFGVKRLFNYKVNNSGRWGPDQNPKERAMLNLSQTLNVSTVANGVTIEVDIEDLERLVNRETGYDLVPILVASWDDVIGENPELTIQVAYTFVASNELRDHVDYTSTEFYPVRGYLHAVQEASLAYGDDFAEIWNATTFLADGTTRIDEWDEVSFIGILCTHAP